MLEWEDINIYPELIHDAIIYVCVLVILCLIAKFIYGWKEKRRLAKEFAQYQQRRKDEEQEEKAGR